MTQQKWCHSALYYEWGSKSSRSWILVGHTAPVNPKVDPKVLLYCLLYHMVSSGVCFLIQISEVDASQPPASLWGKEIYSLSPSYKLKKSLIEELGACSKLRKQSHGPFCVFSWEVGRPRWCTTFSETDNTLENVKMSQWCSRLEIRSLSIYPHQANTIENHSKSRSVAHGKTEKLGLSETRARWKEKTSYRWVSWDMGFHPKTRQS